MTAGERPWVTVLMPVYNGARYVAVAIESILTQSHSDFEFLIIDDGSTDCTPEILADYAARDRRIRVVRQNNRGQAASLNRGLKLARHDWVAIIDHDDVSLPERLARQLELVVQHPEVVVVGSYVIEIDGGGNRLCQRKWGATTITAFRERRARNDWIGLAHPSAMMHRPTIQRLGGYDPAFGPATDTELWSRVSDEHVILVVPETLILYRVHSGSMSTTQFFEAARLTRWIMARQISRRSGKPEPDLESCRRGERGGNGLRLLPIAYQDWVAYIQMRRYLARIEHHGLTSNLLLLAEAGIRPAWAARRAARHARKLVRGYG